MKKILLFLITTLAFISIQPVTAKTTSFYESDFIPNIWMNKKNYNDGLIYYNQARIFKETATNNIAYCIEPFVFFNSNNSYSGTQTPDNYTKEQITDMTLISHFGYGYKNHTDPKWYAITQFLLWKIAEPTGYYYFSEYKNGPEVNLFEEEIKELLNLIEEFKTNTSFNNQTYTIVENTKFSMYDTNNVLNKYIVTSNNATIENNYLKTNELKEGKYTITLERKNQIYNKPILFYQSANNQDIIDTGDPLPNTNKVTINVIKTTLKIYKYDKETAGPTPQGDATLKGTIFSLYTNQNQYIKDIQIEEITPTIIENLNFGTYYLKEKEPGKGYKQSNLNYYFTISENKPNTQIIAYNEVIKGKLKIKKEFGYSNNFNPEQNISFNIFNSKNELIKTIVTDKEGNAEIILPYGQYKLIQLTTTEGYNKIEPINFEIKTEETVYYHLKDYKIEVPNTKTNSLLEKLFIFIRKIICGKKL